jgi:hypothetical protein
MKDIIHSEIIDNAILNKGKLILIAYFDEDEVNIVERCIAEDDALGKLERLGLIEDYDLDYVSMAVDSVANIDEEAYTVYIERPYFIESLCSEYNLLSALVTKEKEVNLLKTIMGIFKSKK